MKAEVESEGTFSHTLREILEGREPIDALFEHPEFEMRARRICARIQRNKEWKELDSEDLFQEACLKVLRFRSFVLDPDNIPDESAFFAWFFVVARNVYSTKLRKMNPTKDAIPIEAISLSDPNVDLESAYLVRDFEVFSRVLPRRQRLTMMLWLQDYSFREIAAVLDREGVKCSHATVRNWISNALMGFREKVLPPATKTMQKRARASK